MSFRRFLAAGAFVLAPVAIQAQDSPAPRAKPAQLPLDSMERARKYTKWFYAGQFDSLIVMVDSANKGKALEQLKQNLSDLSLRAGEETQVIEEKFITRNGARQYWRTAKFSNLSEPILLRWVITPKGEYGGSGLGLARQAPPIDPE